MITSRVVARFLAAGSRTASSLWYHLTDRQKFKLDPKYVPADNAVAIEDRSGRHGIYLGQSVEKWVNGYGYWRPFVVEFKVDPSVLSDPGVHGRYGGEMFVPAESFSKLSIVRVIPLDAYAREEYGEPGWIESGLGHAFDTGEPIDHKTRFPGYRYPGPDVRNMPSTEAMRLKKDLRRVKHSSRSAAGNRNALWHHMTEEQRSYVRRGFDGHDDPVELHRVPIDSFAFDERALEGAMRDNARGSGSHSRGALTLRYDPAKDTFFLIDGYHRFAAARQVKERVIDVEIVGAGYSDYYATPV